MTKSYYEKLKDPKWQKKRLEIMEAAGFKCEMCGSATETLNVHHGYYRSKADPWDYPNNTLWCLCETCHVIAEDIKHDCQLELARINPAFLRMLFGIILHFKGGLFLIDDEGNDDKNSITDEGGFGALIAILADRFNPQIATELMQYASPDFQYYGTHQNH